MVIWYIFCHDIMISNFHYLSKKKTFCDCLEESENVCRKFVAKRNHDFIELKNKFQKFVVQFAFCASFPSFKKFLANFFRPFFCVTNVPIHSSIICKRVWSSSEIKRRPFLAFQSRRTDKKGQKFTRRVTWSRSYDLLLQRQRCKNLQRS
jgi:hypothetical protein